MLEGASGIRHCAEQGLFPCHSALWNGSFYALTQYVPALLIESFGLGGPSALHGLALLSVACFVATVAVTALVVTAHAGRALAAVAVAALLASELPVYADAAFGEMLAAFLTLLFTAALVTRQKAWVAGVTLAAAATTKETALPFLALVALAALAPQWRSRPDTRALIPVLCAGGAAALIVNAAFDFFRYSSVVNHVYAHEAGGIRLGVWPQYALASLAAPNASVWAAWPAAVGVIAIAAISGLQRPAIARLDRLAAVAPAALLLLVLFAFAAYIKPFGWYAWLDRYSVPWVPSLLLLALVNHGAGVRAALARLARRRSAYWAAAVVIALFAVAQTGAITAGQQRSFGWLFGFDRTCPAPISRIDYHDSDLGRCQLHVAWGKTFVLARALGAAAEGPGLALALTTAVAALMLSAFARRELQTRR